MVKVSIIIPVYNTAKYLEDCLESASEQTLKDIEIIIVNDDSTDNSEDIIKKFCDKDNRFNYFKQTHKGVSSARNKGIELAKGEYIFFLDSDDIVAEDYFEKLYTNARKYNSDLVLTDAAAIGNLNINEITTYCTNAGFYRTKFLKQNPELRFPSNINLGEDGIFSHIILTKQIKISKALNQWYFYRQRGTQATNFFYNGNNNCFLIIKKQIEFLKDFYTKNNLFDTHSLHLARYIIIQPFYAEFYYRPRIHFIERARTYSLIKDFYNLHLKNRLTTAEAETLSYHFKRMINSKHFIEFEIKDILLSNPFIHKLVMKRLKRT